jgi:hypothetical protein
MSKQYCSAAADTSRRAGPWSRAAALATLVLLPLQLEATSLRFFGNGVDDIDRIKIPIDNPARPADVGATDFTVELWMRADTTASWGSAAFPCPGSNNGWIYGNILVDRDRLSNGRNYGISVLDRAIAFGVANDSERFTLCGTTDVVSDGQWHHVAVQRRASDGRLSIYVDGVLDAQSSAADGPDGDISYPDGFIGAEDDPFIVIAAEKHDIDPGTFPSFSGWIDEIRISSTERYSGASFAPPSAPFTTDAQTAALYHLDENGGGVAGDSSGAAGGPSDGEIRYGGSPVGPEWSTDTPFGSSPPQPGSIQLANADYSVDESGGSVTLVVRRVGGSAGMATVDYAFQDIDTTLGVDYQAVGGTLTWNDGDATDRPITVTILDDVDPEGTEQFRVSLSNVTGADPGTPLQATVSILDDDDPGLIELVSDSYSVDENVGSGRVSVQVIRRNGSAGAASIRLETRDGSAVSGADYQAVSQIVSWVDGESGTKTVDIDIVDDFVQEPSESFSVDLLDQAGASLGTTTSATVDILDDDTPGTIRLASATASVDEGDTVTVVVQRVNGSSGPVTVDYVTSDLTATAGSDYESRIGTLTWPNGDTSDRSFTITTLNDSTPEGGEDFRVTLSNVTGGALGTPSEADISIVDNDTPGIVSFGSANYSVDEADGSVSIQVVRLDGNDGAASVLVETRDGSAVAGTDYRTVSQTISWADGESGIKTVQITILDDAVEESSESFELVLRDPTVVGLGSTTTTQVTVGDNDTGSGGTVTSSGGGGGGGLGWPLLAFLTLVMVSQAGRPRGISFTHL